jgi:hypothetical protein
MDIMTVINAVILLFGIYMAVAALLMKKKGIVNDLIVPKEEIHKCKDTAAFIHFIYWKEAAFGGILAVAGGLGIISQFVISFGNLKYVGLAIFLFAFLWFQLQLKNARERFW